MIPPPKPWEQHTFTGNALTAPSQSQAISTSTVASSTATEIPQSTADGFMAGVDSGYGINYGTPFGGYGMGMYGGFGGGMFGGMYNPMCGPLMEIERSGQLIYMFCSRVMDMLGMLTYMGHAAGAHFSEITHAVTCTIMPSADQEQNHGSPGVSFYYSADTQTRHQRIRKILLKLLWRIVLFVVLYRIATKMQGVFMYRQFARLW
mmetsp:Transcript_783/g.1331  ORF Transcript_783/g.1331 Transcript_783/m.1331 type:complete len:205 (-) Transcript_783:8-622(-)